MEFLVRADSYAGFRFYMLCLLKLLTHEEKFIIIDDRYDLRFWKCIRIQFNVVFI